MSNTTLWTRRDLADYLRVDVRTTYKMQASGAIPPPLIVGASNRWDPITVENWIKEQQQCHQH